MTESTATIRSKSVALAIGAALAIASSIVPAGSAHAADYPPDISAWDAPSWAPQGNRHGRYWYGPDELGCRYQYEHRVYWAARQVSVHRGPGQHYPISRHLPRGTRLVVVATCHGWSELAAGGWVRSDLLTTYPHHGYHGHRTYPTPPVEPHHDLIVVPGSTVPVATPEVAESLSADPWDFIAPPNAQGDLDAQGDLAPAP